MEVDYVWGTSSNNVPVQKLEQHFRENFESLQPEYYVKVPGRVNLIGEHVDYCGYSVFPMAIDQCIVVAAKRTTDRQTVELTNLCTERYENVSKNISDISAESLGKSPSWSNYFMCGVKGAREYLSDSQLKAVEKVGFLFAITGNIPESSGLSSSSALVTAAVMATLVGYGVPISRLELAEISAKCERYIGTAGGGMDQAIAVNAKQGYAARIDFNPLAVKQFRLPADAKFIVAQSLAVKNKAASNDFNTRVVECRLASQIIAKQLNLEWEQMAVLATLQKRSGNSLDRMIELVHQHLHVDAYSKSEVCEILSVSEDQLDELSLTANTTNVAEFYLHQRALHVFEEAKRMEEFCRLCENSGAASDLGRLMDDSHSSLRDLYQCSHPDLEELVALSKREGAYGCKLTGAGWGGCVVVMVPSDGAEEFVKSVRDQYFSNRETCGRRIDELVFATSPSEGACCVHVKTTSISDGIADQLPALVHL
ncbi:N-acetylgalactosamine kinase [Acyrthosiphon pisum]|uniref:N-acetylgalactosamine kinase n=1 Tax=Acyrthosiphon pisum TaxID=7029 RepID=A0A8R2JQX6_ACYPI|nr:N-acetylgalactosamine kinase [Acyrthosiphon pisum]